MSNVNPNPQEEQLSAWCDGELPAHEARFLLRRLAHDRPLRACYERYVAIGITLRGEARMAPAGFADAVLAQIARETPATRMPGWLRAAAGGAIAAGVAAITLFAVIPPRADAPAGLPTLAETSRLRDSDMRASVPLERVTERQSFSVPVGTPATPVNTQVESYFLRHSGASWSAGRGGYVPYVYVVATPRQAQATRTREATSGR